LSSVRSDSGSGSFDCGDLFRVESHRCIPLRDLLEAGALVFVLEDGSVALNWTWPRETELRSRFPLDDSGEFGERGRDAPMRARINPELVVAAPNVLPQRVTAHDHACGVVTFEFLGSSGTVALRRRGTFRAAARRRMGDLSGVE
jgi:hypothetical protein